MHTLKADKQLNKMCIFVIYWMIYRKRYSQSSPYKIKSPSLSYRTFDKKKSQLIQISNYLILGCLWRDFQLNFDD